jgi:hypothetical protein
MSKLRKHVWMWVVYVRPPGGHLCKRGESDWKFFPFADYKGDGFTFYSRESAAPLLREQKLLRGSRNAYLQKVGPWH